MAWLAWLLGLLGWLGWLVWFGWLSWLVVKPIQSKMTKPKGLIDMPNGPLVKLVDRKIYENMV